MSSQTLITTKLTEGPAHKGLGFKKIVEALETDVFIAYHWQPYQFEKTEKLDEIEMSIIPNQAIIFSYVFEDLEENNVENLKKMIDLEARLRLFKTEIEVKKF